MFKVTASLALLSLLSACTLVDGDQYSQKTLDAMAKSDQKLSQQLESVNLNLSNQTDYIESLESSIINLTNEVEVLKKNQRTTRVSSPTRAATSSSNKDKPELLASTVPNLKAGMIALGSLEHLYIDVVKSEFTARIDTGATTSSINAVDMQEFDRNGKRWVKFHVSDDSDPKARKWVEAPIIRHVKIRQSSSDQVERRPVVELWIQIGKVHEKAQFTLADRSQMDYPILLGREFIQDIAVVDVSRKFIQKKHHAETKK
ncbi:ATP-dependent zinc protease family protein [Vibrio algicola]|uniref:ATP-dependent Zn protease n=1 Tax=Vibrio algicola TaxID=2662262 RepID=A0A5Q0TGV4_9VIBR|nr:ATP-dependent zinc protease [Vibrio algicola]